MSGINKLVYTDASGVQRTDPNLTFETSTQYPGTRLDTNNLDVNNNASFLGNLGIGIGNPRQTLEVSGRAIINSQGSSSQNEREYGLNGNYDTVSLLSPFGLGLNGSASIFFGLNSQIYYPLARIVAADNLANGTGSLTFQTGQNGSLVNRLQIDNEGNILINGGSFLYSTVTLDKTYSVFSLTFPTITTATSTIVDVYITIGRTGDIGDTSLVKFTVFLNGNAAPLYINNISVQQTGSIQYLTNRNISAFGPKVFVNFLNNNVDQTILTVNYMAYGPAAASVNNIIITSPDTKTLSVPSTPLNFTATSQNQSLLLNWDAPSDGGSVITGYSIYTTDVSGNYVDASGNINAIQNFLLTSTDVLTNTQMTVSKIRGVSLTNGTTYTFNIKAKNSVAGFSPVATVTGTPATNPGAPTSVVATLGNASASVAFTAPASNGGLAITSYTATSTPGSFTATNAVSPIIVTGLTNGTPYTFTVTATNSGGLTSVASAASNSVTPGTVADAPTISSVVQGINLITLNWTTGGSNGGYDVTAYKILSTTNGVTTTYLSTNIINITTTIASGTISTLSNPIVTTIRALTLASSYTFQVVATNAQGDSAASTASSPVIFATIPGNPTATSATAAASSALLQWTTPASNGGMPIITYNINDSSGNAYTNLTTTDSSGNATDSSGNATYLDSSGNYPVSKVIKTTVNGLINGTAYIFNVKVSNILGDSTGSGVFSSVTPKAAPSPPTVQTQTVLSATSVSLVWTAGSNNGSPLTAYAISDANNTVYTYTSVDSSGSITNANINSRIGNTITTTVTGLTQGIAYTFTVSTTNANGTSPVISFLAVTPAVAPGPPTSLTAVSGSGSITLSWTAPVSNGGSAITGYSVYDNSSNNLVATSTSTSATVSGLTNGTSYQYYVKSQNAIGLSTASSASAATVAGALNVSALTVNTTTTLGSSSGSASVVATVNGSVQVNGNLSISKSITLASRLSGTPTGTYLQGTLPNWRVVTETLAGSTRETWTLKSMTFYFDGGGNTTLLNLPSVNYACSITISAGATGVGTDATPRTAGAAYQVSATQAKAGGSLFIGDLYYQVSNLAIAKSIVGSGEGSSTLLTLSRGGGGGANLISTLDIIVVIQAVPA